MTVSPDTIRSVFGLLRQMSSLDLSTVVRKSCDVLTEITGAERALLVDVGADPELAPCLIPIDSGELQVSRSSIEECVRTREQIRRTTGLEGVDLSTSMMSLRLQSVLVHPIIGPDDQVIAVAYMDSQSRLSSAGDDAAINPQSTWLLDSVLQQLGYSLRNAVLHGRLRRMNETLEDRVRERTRQLEENRSQLIAQDRLATLGRLVAAIAHEINNPVGAIVSFVQSLRENTFALWDLSRSLQDKIEDDGHREVLRGLLERMLDRDESVYLDSRRRREHEQKLQEAMREEGLDSAAFVARRLARLNVSSEDASALVPLLQDDPNVVLEPLTVVHTVRRSLTSIEVSAQTLSRIVRGLKTYTHLDRAEKEVGDLHTSLQATLEVVAPSIPAGVEVHTDFEELPPFPHYPGELSQVWTNLIDNAVRAMGEEGQLSIRTRRFGDQALVEVEDTGEGIPAKLMSRIFDLDTTSRGPGAGLGLGLPICRAIVQNRHGGEIGFESLRTGTRFRVSLPLEGPDEED